MRQVNGIPVKYKYALQNRQPDFLNTSARTTKSQFKTLTQRYLQELSARPYGQRTRHYRIT